MNRLFLLLLLAVVPCLPIRADVGDWRLYSAYHNAQQTVFLHGKVYVLSDGGLYSYDPEDTSVETYDKATVLSDFDIYAIVPCEQTNELVIVYKSGNIDILDANGEVYNLPDLKLKSLSDKTLNDVVCKDGVVYICAGQGVLCLNMDKHLFGSFYTFGEVVRSFMVFEGEYYVLTTQAVYKGSPNDNLLDPSNWSTVRAITWLYKLRAFNGQVYASLSSGMSHVFDLSKFSTRTILSSVKVSRSDEVNGRFFFFLSTGGVYELTGEEELARLENDANIVGLAFGKNRYWAACGTEGLKGYTLGEDHVLTEAVSSIIPNSPQRNFAYHLTMAPGQRLLVAGGAFNYPEVRQAGTLLKYENNTWTTFDEDGPLELVGSSSYMNLTDLVQDPLDPEHHWASAARSGLYEFRNYKLVNHYSYDNSPLQSIVPDNAHPENYVRVTALAFDSDNNLWMCNNELSTILYMLTKDGKWNSYYVPEIDAFTTFDRIIFDRRGWAWFNSRRSAPNSTAGFCVINTNGNPSNPSGFSHRFISTLNNQDGKSYSPNFFFSITEDLDGAIWLGCESGLFMTEHPENVFDPSFTLTQVKVPRNDGSNLADYLLSEVLIKCVTIDGGNRKWVGTGSNGVYLISADGLEQIAHFTTENSPLISDDIYDIAIDGRTGEVFIATSAGLVSYHGNAIDPADGLSESNVKVYPNPVRPGYAGNIVITGLAYNTNVKIVNASGRLVAEGTSIGGEFTWNGRLSSGQRCASGIYYVLATDSEGNKGVASKFLMVKE